MAYLTHVSGEAFAEYFRRGQTWGDGGMQAALVRQFDLTSRAEFLQEFAKQAVQKVSTRLLHGTPKTPNSRRPRSERSIEQMLDVNTAGSYPRLFPDARPDDRRNRPRPARGPHHVRRDPRTVVLPRLTSGNPRSTPGSCSTATGQSSRHAPWTTS